MGHSPFTVMAGIFLLSFSVSIHGASLDSKVGTKVEGFTLPAITGEAWELSKLSDAKYVALVFVGTECPLMQHYGPRLGKFAEEMKSKGVELVAIDSNVQDSKEEVADFAKGFGWSFPVLLDPDANLASRLGATRTPQVILLDSDRTIRYSGPIDDQGRVGYVRMRKDRDHLFEAVDELAAGKTVSQAEIAPIGCLIGRKREAETTTGVTYAKEISRIFQKRCVECHRAGEIGPFAMEKYEEIVGWADMIGEVVSEERMPPWFANPAHGKFSNDPRLTSEEKEMIASWIKAGAPLGDPKDLPEPRKFVDGWNIGEPDEVVAMADAPFLVPADGTLSYRHFVVDPGWKEERWLSACEVRPGERSIVHHVFVFCLPPDAFPPDAKGEVEIKGRKLGLTVAKVIFDGGLVGGYAPGTPPYVAPPGVALRFPAGSKLLFQMHYTPNGIEKSDLTHVGFKFADESTITQEAAAIGAKNFRFIIPANKPDHMLRSFYTFEKDCWVNEFVPHMHLRGKSFQFVAKYPDGRREMLLDVPRYDFNWQIPYKPVQPIFMPKGTVMECEAHYDNSKNNPANPDPNAIVRPGEQTWDEMMIGWFSMVTPRASASEKSNKAGGDDVSAR